MAFLCISSYIASACFEVSSRTSFWHTWPLSIFFPICSDPLWQGALSEPEDPMSEMEEPGINGLAASENMRIF